MTRFAVTPRSSRPRVSQLDHEPPHSAVCLASIVTDPNGHKTTYCNDPLDRPRVVYDPLGHQHNSTYDVDGNVLQFATGTGSTISKASYDTNDNPISVTDPTNVSTSLSYGDSGHPYYPTSVTDGQGSQLGYW